MVDFSKFDKKVDLEELQKEVNESKDSEYDKVPDGTYIVSIVNMEVKETKAGDKLMFSVQCRIKEGEHRGRFIFFNRVICGNKATEKWNDGKAIKSVCTWVNKLIDFEDPVSFVNYADFAEQILDVYQEVQHTVELKVSYKEDDFNSIRIQEVYDL